jgi:signal recognition particle subunit SRP54
LVNRFFEARKMMSSLATGTMPGLPGMPGAGRPPSRQSQKKKKTGRGVSGNPAKRSQQSAERAAAAGGGDGAAAFGGGELDEKALQQALGDFQLPPELRSRLGK